MGEWLSYRPADFLRFSDRIYWRLFELENAVLMPLPVLAPLLAAAAGVLSRFRPRMGLAALAALLAAGWALAGFGFFWQRYAPINWMAGYLLPLFLLQSLLLAGVAAAQPARMDAADAARWTGSGLLGWSMLLHPLLAVLDGRPLAQAEIVGIAPDPTAIATLGLALLLPRGRWRALLLAIPALWLALSALTLWLLGTWLAAVPALAMLATVAALAAGRRGAR